MTWVVFASSGLLAWCYGVPAGVTGLAGNGLYMVGATFGAAIVGAITYATANAMSDFAVRFTFVFVWIAVVVALLRQVRVDSRRDDA
jgi:hypothetical protein